MKHSVIAVLVVFVPVVSSACGGMRMASYDADKDGKVTFEEFSGKIGESKRLQEKTWTEAAANVNNRLQRQFSATDVNKDGIIDISNDFRVLDKVVNGYIDNSESNGREMAFNDRNDFKKIDVNNDGSIYFQEYFNYEQSRYKKELAAVQDKYSDLKVRDAFSGYDANKDGVADAGEVEKKDSELGRTKACGGRF